MAERKLPTPPPAPPVRRALERVALRFAVELAVAELNETRPTLRALLRRRAL